LTTRSQERQRKLSPVAHFDRLRLTFYTQPSPNLFLDTQLLGVEGFYECLPLFYLFVPMGRGQQLSQAEALFCCDGNLLAGTILFFFSSRRQVIGSLS